MRGFAARLVEHRTGSAGVAGSNLFEVRSFFRLPCPYALVSTFFIHGKGRFITVSIFTGQIKLNNVLTDVMFCCFHRES